MEGVRKFSIGRLHSYLPSGHCGCLVRAASPEFGRSRRALHNAVHMQQMDDHLSTEVALHGCSITYLHLKQQKSCSSKAGQRERRTLANEFTTREAILKAAVRSFLARGYGGTSMDQVAKEASVGRRTVYNQFESKKALFDATLIRLWKQNPLADLVSRIDTTRPPEEGLTQIGNSIADFWAPEESIAFVRMIIAESIHFPELARTFVSTGRNPARQAVSSYLQQMNDIGQLNIPDPDFARAQFVELILGQLAWLRVLGEPAVPSKERCRHVVSEAVKMFLARYSAVNIIR